MICSRDLRIWKKSKGEHAPFKAPLAQRGVAERSEAGGIVANTLLDDPSVSLRLTAPFAQGSLLVAHAARAVITHGLKPPSDEGGVMERSDMTEGENSITIRF